MALATSIESLVSLVKQSRPATAGQLEEIRRLDIQIGAECLKRGIGIPEFAMSSRFLKPFGMTRIPRLVYQSGEYCFFATDGWVQAMGAVQYFDTESGADDPAKSESSVAADKLHCDLVTYQQLADIVCNKKASIQSRMSEWKQNHPELADKINDPFHFLDLKPLLIKQWPKWFPETSTFSEVLAILANKQRD